MDCIGRGGKGGGSPGHSSLPLWADKAKSVRAVQWVAVSVSERTTVRLEIIQENVHMATVEIICWSVVMMIRVWHIFKSMMCSLKKKKEKKGSQDKGKSHCVRPKIVQFYKLKIKWEYIPPVILVTVLQPLYVNGLYK